MALCQRYIDIRGRKKEDAVAYGRMAASLKTHFIAWESDPLYL
jgi:hypothetical protein